MGVSNALKNTALGQHLAAQSQRRKDEREAKKDLEGLPDTAFTAAFSSSGLRNLAVSDMTIEKNILTTIKALMREIPLLCELKDKKILPNSKKFDNGKSQVEHQLAMISQYDIKLGKDSMALKHSVEEMEALIEQRQDPKLFGHKVNEIDNIIFSVVSKKEGSFIRIFPFSKQFEKAKQDISLLIKNELQEMEVLRESLKHFVEIENKEVVVDDSAKKDMQDLISKLSKEQGSSEYYTYYEVPYLPEHLKKLKNIESAIINGMSYEAQSLRIIEKARKNYSDFKKRATSFEQNVSVLILSHLGAFEKEYLAAIRGKNQPNDFEEFIKRSIANIDASKDVVEQIKTELVALSNEQRKEVADQTEKNPDTTIDELRQRISAAPNSDVKGSPVEIDLGHFNRYISDIKKGDLSIGYEVLSKLSDKIIQEASNEQLQRFIDMLEKQTNPIFSKRLAGFDVSANSRKMLFDILMNSYLYNLKRSPKEIESQMSFAKVSKEALRNILGIKVHEKNYSFLGYLEYLCNRSYDSVCEGQNGGYIRILRELFDKNSLQNANIALGFDTMISDPDDGTWIGPSAKALIDYVK